MIWWNVIWSRMVGVWMVDSCYYKITYFDFLFSQVSGEFDDSKGIIYCFPNTIIIVLYLLGYWYWPWMWSCLWCWPWFFSWGWCRWQVLKGARGGRGMGGGRRVGGVEETGGVLMLRSFWGQWLNDASIFHQWKTVPMSWALLFCTHQVWQVRGCGGWTSCLCSVHLRFVSCG